MSSVLMIGLLFWICVAFFGSRSMFIKGQGAFYFLLKSIKTRSPVLLITAALICYAIAFTFCSMEIDAIQEKQGIIGIFFMISVISGVIGSLLSSASLFIDS